jgi:hypothetical protein
MNVKEEETLDDKNLELYKNSRKQHVLRQYGSVTGSIKQCVVVKFIHC